MPSRPSPSHAPPKRPPWTATRAYRTPKARSSAPAHTKPCTPRRSAFSAVIVHSGFSLSVVPVATDNGEMQRDYWYSVERRLEALEGPEVDRPNAAERTLRRLGARQVGTWQVPVVFDPETAASLLRHLAARHLGILAVQRHLVSDRASLGEQIAPDLRDVFDDGDAPARPGLAAIRRRGRDHAPHSASSKTASCAATSSTPTRLASSTARTTGNAAARSAAPRTSAPPTCISSRRTTVGRGNRRAGARAGSTSPS